MKPQDVVFNAELPLIVARWPDGRLLHFTGNQGDKWLCLWSDMPAAEEFLERYDPLATPEEIWELDHLERVFTEALSHRYAVVIVDPRVDAYPIEAARLVEYAKLYGEIAGV